MSQIGQEIHALHRAAAKAKYTGDQDDFWALATPENIIGLTTLLLRMDHQLRVVHRKAGELAKELQYSVPLRMYREAVDKNKPA